MSGGESVVVSARELARVLSDAALFTRSGKDYAGTHISAVELSCSDGVLHACASDTVVAAWARAELEFGDSDGRAILDVVDAKRVAAVVTPRKKPEDEDEPNQHLIALTFHTEQLAVSMSRVDDPTEPDWSTDLVCPIQQDLFGKPLFPHVPSVILSGATAEAGPSEWAASGTQLAQFTKTIAARRDVIRAEMTAPDDSGRRKIRVRIGELFTGLLLGSATIESDDMGEPLPPIAARAAATEQTYTRPVDPDPEPE